MKCNLLWCALLVAIPLATGAHDKEEQAGSSGLAGTVVFIVRHAEKPDDGDGLAPLGRQRADLYVNYFKDSGINSIFAAADSSASHRPVLTVTPLAHSLGLAVDSRFKDKQYEKLVAELRERPHGRHILICWHHGEIPQLIRALGGNSDSLIPGGKWPEQVFGWVIQLRYDETGKLIEARRINENLLPDDAAGKM